MTDFDNILYTIANEMAVDLKGKNIKLKLCDKRLCTVRQEAMYCMIRD